MCGPIKKQTLFSSPEPRAQVSLLIKICSLCVVVVVVIFSHFHLLQSLWANFNQTWHKASLGEGDSSLYKWSLPPFRRGDNYEIAKIQWQIFKIFFFGTTSGPFSSGLGTLHPRVKGIQVCTNERLCLFPKRDNYEIRNIHWRNFKIFFSRTMGQYQSNMAHKSSLGEGYIRLFKWRVPLFIKGRR